MNPLEQTSMNPFDQAITLNEVPSLDDSVSNQVSNYNLTISPDWNVMIGPNGGYIAAILLKAMKNSMAGTPTRSITVHFLSASVPGPAQLRVEILKQGRSISTCNALLTQGQRTIASATATFAEQRLAIDFCDVKMPDVLPPNQIPVDSRMNSGSPHFVPFRDQYDQRLAVGAIPPENNGSGLVGGWTRFKHPRAFDDLAILAISDSWFPGISARQTSQKLQAPTLDHTVHILADLPLVTLREDDFLLVEFSTQTAALGYLIENGRIWASTGQLLAVSRQLAVMLPIDS
ncbi:MAG: thioesterase family protein [Gammaproteobacteria bacterium]|jgi:acyl-CoA thioesterase|nr:thioesterase family protein [Gammaproteobacteria bacterium]MBT6247336.1 thioesterase family protein [Gammaproteobacteria bacterium]